MRNPKRTDELTLTQIIERTIKFCEEDIMPLFNYLKVEKPNNWRSMSVANKADFIETRLRYMGSNDIATWFRDGKCVEYDEIVNDVGSKLGVPVKKELSTAHNEELIINKMFEDIINKMSDDEKRQLLKSLGISDSKIPLGSISATAVISLLKQSGFWVYKTSVIVANVIAKALLGRGLAFATNAAVTRTIGVILGPVGWILSGAWLAIDIAGPAFRCTVPSVIHVALLRNILQSRINIGVVGDGSSGKDSLIRCVFGVDTGNVSPIAGSTSQMEIYRLGASNAVSLTNYPGFNDIRPEVNRDIDENLNHTDVFILAIDISRGVSDTDVKIFKKINQYNRPVLVCLNKIDLPRTKKDLSDLIAAARSRISAKHFEQTCFDPDPRIWETGPEGCDKVHHWICEQVKNDGKQSDHIPRGF